MKPEQIKQALRRKKKKAPPADGLSSGSTLLNCASTGDPRYALHKGKYYFFVGDSQSGKTWITLSILAEASINPAFSDYRLIYNNGEDGALMDLQHYFGKSLAERLEFLHDVKIEHFYDSLDKCFADGRPFLMIQDSMDVLGSIAEDKAAAKQRKAREEDEDAKGSYGDGKAKYNSSHLRGAISQLRDSGSVLIIINQTRDNLRAGPFGSPKTRSGGHALTFYATMEYWTSVREKLKKRVRGKDRNVGTLVNIRVKKNRITGRERSVHVPIYHSLGIDDTGSCIDFLIEEKHWKVKQGVLSAPEFDFSGEREDLIRQIEEEDSIEALRQTVGRVWQEIEEACQVKRKSRYNT